MYKNTRDASSNQEKKIAKSLGGKRTPNSGATPFYKGDVCISANNSNWLIEAKTCMEPKKSFSIKQDWLYKMQEEQYATKKDYSALCFDFGDNKDRFYIVDENTFMYMMDILSENNNKY